MHNTTIITHPPLGPSAVRPAKAHTRVRSRRLLSALEHPGDVFRDLGPNWYASIMGTGILANAAILLPTHAPVLHSFALGVWVLAATLLVALTLATAVHWLRYPKIARGHHRDPAMAPFYGAPPMAVLTVGAGALLVGRDLIGLPAAITLDEILWTLGTVTGLASTIVIPYLMFTRLELARENTLATWLMPIVPPMVSAATGAGLIAHLPAGQDRLAMLLCCYAMFGISLLASLVTITLLWGRLAYDGVGPARTVPTLWIVLGPLGQSITAVSLLANVAPSVISQPYAGAMQAIAVLYGIPVWGFAIIWLLLAATITLRTARHHLPFSLTWWSFTFPVGTLVTGTSELALHTHANFLTGASIALYALLTGAWLTAATATASGSLNGRLFLPTPTPELHPAPATS
ncbi:MAG TPA: TDT family transporter [Solirubrobacteraceae bacterium]|nr:TDT family transporter [Solirubrobacteraceae bacterium]